MRGSRNFNDLIHFESNIKIITKMSSKEDDAKASVMPTWPLCKAVALEVVRELGLDYYDDPEHLPFDEVLRLLARTRYLNMAQSTKV